MHALTTCIVQGRERLRKLRGARCADYLEHLRYLEDGIEQKRFTCEQLDTTRHEIVRLAAEHAGTQALTGAQAHMHALIHVALLSKLARHLPARNPSAFAA